MANNIINRHSTINVDSSLGVILSSNNSQINHTGAGNLEIHTLGTLNIGATGAINFTSDVNFNSDPTFNSDLTLGKQDNVVKYFYLENSSNNTKHWRVSVDSTGNLNFEKYNGAAWVNKMNLQ